MWSYGHLEKRFSKGVTAVAFATIFSIVPLAARAQTTSFAMSGNTGHSDSSGAVQSNITSSPNRAASLTGVRAPHFDVPTPFYAQGFTERYRPYPLVERPSYRLEANPAPVRRVNFSMGYLSTNGFGSYYF